MTYANGHGGSALSLDDRKRAMRRDIGRVMARGAAPGLGVEIGGQVRARVWLPPSCTVAGFLGFLPEPDLMQLMGGWQRDGHHLALPRTPKPGLPLTFHRWGEGDRLVRERFQTLTSDGPEVAPDLILVPLLAFDRQGHRLGHGGGFYDRTLALRPGVPTIGCGYAAVEVAEVPAGPHDVLLDAVATEREFIITGKRACAFFS